MQIQFSILTLLTFFLMGCQGPSSEMSIPAQTAEEFGNQVLSSLQEEDAATFERLLLTKKEARKIFRNGNGRVSFKEFWTRAESEQTNLFSNLITNADFKGAELDSVSVRPSVPKGMDPLFMLNRDACEIATVQVFFRTTEGKPMELSLRNAIQLPGSPWRISDRPTVRPAE